MPLCSDGDFLRLGRANSPESSPIFLQVPYGEFRGRQNCLCTQDIVHVGGNAICIRGLNIFRSFVAVLFFDAVQRMFRITAESDLAKSGQQATDVRTETNLAARKF